MSWDAIHLLYVSSPRDNNFDYLRTLEDKQIANENPLCNVRDQIELICIFEYNKQS